MTDSQEPLLQAGFSAVELVALRSYYRSALLEDCLPFWFPACVDEEYGGFLHFRDRDGSLLDSDKSIWAQGRMSWMLMRLCESYGEDSDWLRWAESGLQFLRTYGFDHDGRMFFHTTRDGRPLRKRRYAYSESFAAIAFAIHAKLTGDSASRLRAMQLFKAFTSVNFEPGGMLPKFTDTRPSISLAPRMITIVTARELIRCLGDDGTLEVWIDRCMREILQLFVHPEYECVFESVAPDGTVIDHVDGRTLNPGHAIEGAWFILHEGKLRQDQQLVRQGCQMLDWMWRRGWDSEFGGLFYFRDALGRPVQEYWHDMKFWWPHNEAMVATLLAWQLTGAGHYATWHRQLLDWCQRHFVDETYGEWYGYLHRDGSISNPVKGNLWKSFFHLPRALWMCETLCGELTG